MLGTEFGTVDTAECAAYSAALLAATGAGAFESGEAACRAVIRVTGSTAPGADRGVYAKRYPVYRELYPALKPIVLL